MINAALNYDARLKYRGLLLNSQCTRNTVKPRIEAPGFRSFYQYKLLDPACIETRRLCETQFQPEVFRVSTSPNHCCFILQNEILGILFHYNIKLTDRQQ